MKTRIAINGFGRIGRLALRRLMNEKEVEVVAVNDLSNIKTLAHLLKYDSNHGKFPLNVDHDEDTINIDGYGDIKVFAQRNPEELPWNELKIDIVLECTGVFCTLEGSQKHITAGSKKVIISAPAKGGGVKTVVMGVNHESITNEDLIISNASCTTNCIAPVLKVLDDNFGIKHGLLTTVHAYTAAQRLLDAPHKDLRRARAAAISIVPTTTGAASAVGIVLPHLQGKLDGLAYRVPTPTGSMSEMTLILEKDVTVEEINNTIKKAAEGPLKGILKYETDPIVSIDIVGDSHSSIFDSLLTNKLGDMVKFMSWYDNEMGYASRCADLISYVSKLK